MAKTEHIDVRIRDRAILLAILLTLVAMPASAQKPDSALGEDTFAREKELLSLTETTQDSRQLFRIYNSLALLFKDNARELAYLDEMEKCAKAARSPHDEATAMLMRLEYYSICNDTDALLDYAGQVRKFMDAHNDRRIANVETIVIKRQIDEGRNQTALYDAQEILRDAAESNDRYKETYAYYNIGLAYSAGGQYRESVTALEKGADLMRGADIPAIDRILIEMELAESNYSLADYGQSLSWNDLALNHLEEYMADDSTEEQRAINYRSMHLYILCNYVRNSVQLGEMDQASDYLAKAGEDLYPHIGLDGEYYNSTCALYYRALGRTAEAVEYADKSVAAFREADLQPYYLSALKLKTGLLADLGQWQEAYRNLEYIGAVQDSLSVDNFVMQFSELHTKYEVDKLQTQKSRQRLVIIFIGIACLLLATAAVITIIYSFRLRSKNRMLYNRIQEARRSDDTAARALQLTSEESLSREMRLYRRILLLMENEHPFTDASFGRTSLVKALNTNDKYLADAVREGAGETVATYITDWRLNYSLKCLAEYPDRSIEEISELSGFGAYSSFYRLFMRKYGMSPSDYRKFNYQKNDVK